jgi:hypothetical protein
MPLVVSKAKLVHYVKNEQTLAEFLGHDNFDGMPWAIGDRLIFEDGTESRIRQEPGELFHTWDDPTPADFADVKRSLNVPDARNWQELFATFTQARGRGR